MGGVVTREGARKIFQFFLSFRVYAAGIGTLKEDYVPLSILFEF